MIRIGLIQMRCEKSALTENMAHMSCCLNEAAARDIDIVGFPEMCLTGYADPTRYLETKLRLDGPEIGRLLQMTTAYSSTVLAGLIEDNPPGKPFITQIATRQGQLLGRYRKKTIKGEEAEWFSAGDKVPIFQHDQMTFGITICIDFYRELAAEVKLGGRSVLEVACGTGRVSIRLAKEGASVLGLDLSPTMLEVARQKSVGLENMRWVQGDMRSFDLGEVFGLVIIPGHAFQYRFAPFFNGLGGLNFGQILFKDRGQFFTEVIGQLQGG